MLQAFFARVIAVAFPMPRDAPVTRAVFPSNPGNMLILSILEY
jgi:hypothetical protein